MSPPLNLGVLWGWILATTLEKALDLGLLLPELDLNQQPCD